MRCGNRACEQAPEFAEILGHNSGSHAVIGALVRGGVESLAQLRAMPDADALAIEGVGIGTIRRLTSDVTAPIPGDTRRLPVTDDVAVEFEEIPGERYGERIYSIAVITPGDDPAVVKVTLRGRFFNSETAAKWADKRFPAGTWAVAPISRTHKRGEG